MPAQFVNAGGSVTFSRAPGRAGRDQSLLQASELSTGAERYGYPIYGKDQVVELPLRLTETERGQFITFWNSAARGMANSFTYTDVLGIAATARFADAKLPDIIEKTYDCYIVTVRLLIL